MKLYGKADPRTEARGAQGKASLPSLALIVSRNKLKTFLETGRIRYGKGADSKFLLARAIVTYLREQGSSLAKITVNTPLGSWDRTANAYHPQVGEEYDEEQDEAYVDPDGINLVSKVSTKAPFHVSSSNGDMHVALIDCGVKGLCLSK